jgi:hypothetical protein
MRLRTGGTVLIAMAILAAMIALLIFVHSST